MASVSCTMIKATVPVRAAFKPASSNKTVQAKPATVSNTKAASAFMIWQPVDNKFFETFSYLPALSDSEISKQVDYMVRNSWTPCLEFSDPETAYTSNTNTVRMGAVTSNYYDNRYWTMWKLPMFGCTDGSQVLKEVAACTKAFPNAYVRLVAFDASRQVQVAGFLVHRPAAAKEWKAPEDRSVA